MTWVVGAPTMFGYAFGISDVRVTVGDDRIDCLQKVHPIGKDYPNCRDAIQAFSADHKERLFMQGEVGCQGGMASMLGNHLTTILKEVQPEGVSSHLHYCWVYRGRTILKTNDHAVKGRWTIASLGSGINQPSPEVDPSNFQQKVVDDGTQLFNMPRLAGTWEDLLKVLRDRGLKASSCIA